MFWNSMLLAFASALGNGFVGVMVGFMLSKIQFHGRGVIKLIYIIVMMMPFQVTLLPNYLVLTRGAGLLDTFWVAAFAESVCAAWRVFDGPILPERAHEEIRAARVDNATFAMFMGRIILPRVWPGFAACVLLSFAEAWNMVEQPLVFLSYAVALSAVDGV